MTYENQILDALMTVLAWDDIQDENFAQAVNDQAKLMTGHYDPDQLCEDHPDAP